MKEKRGNRTSFRVSESYLQGIEVLKKQYLSDSEADIVHKALAHYIRGTVHDWNDDLQKLCDRLQYGFDSTMGKEK